MLKKKKDSKMGFITVKVANFVLRDKRILRKPCSFTSHIVQPFFLFFVCFVDSRTHVAQAGLKFSVEPRVTLSS